MKILSSISPLDSSTVPSASPISIKVLSSDSVTMGFVRVSLPPSSLIIIFGKRVNIKTKGHVNFISKFTNLAFLNAIDSDDNTAKVLGVSKFAQFYKIILPQMLRLAVPNLSNVWQITLKDTSLISVTGLVEIMRQSYIAAGSTRDPLFFYSFAAVLYLLLTYLSMKLINRLEAKYSRGY